MNIAISLKVPKKEPPATATELLASPEKKRPDALIMQPNALSVSPNRLQLNQIWRLAQGLLNAVVDELPCVKSFHQYSK